MNNIIITISNASFFNFWNHFNPLILCTSLLIYDSKNVSIQFNAHSYRDDIVPNISAANNNGMYIIQPITFPIKFLNLFTI